MVCYRVLASQGGIGFPDFTKTSTSNYGSTGTLTINMDEWVFISLITQRTHAKVYVDNILVSQSYSSDDDMSCGFANYFAPLKKGAVIKWSSDDICLITLIPFIDN